MAEQMAVGRDGLKAEELIPGIGVLAGWAAAGSKGWRGKANTSTRTGIAARLH